MIKYLVCPGYVTSKNDKQRHFISFIKLVELYKVPVHECADADRPETCAGIRRELKILCPSYKGNYSL